MTPPTPNPSAGGAGDQPAPTQTSPRAAGGWWARYGKWLAYIAATAAAAAVGALTGRQVLPPPLPVLKTVEADDPPAAYGQGWVCDPDEVATVADRMRGPRLFADTPAGRTGQDLPSAVYGWKAYEVLFARPPPVKNQGQVGSCVSFGTNSAVERTLAAEIGRRGGVAGEWTRFAEEATYGGSRVEIGGGRIRGDGSIGVWAADFVTKYGCVPRAAYPTADLTTYSEARCRQWGDRGVPTEFEAEARKFPVKAYSQVKSWTDAKKAMAQGYFIAVCSNQGFAMRRDANGVCRPQGAWAHCVPYGTMISTQIPKPCQDVRVGDRVVSHDGRLHAVKQVHTREYDDDLITVKVDGMVPTSFTLHHPVLVYRPMRAHGTKFAPGLAMAVYAGGKYAALVNRYAAWEAGNPVWLAAEEIRDGDYVLSPPVKPEGGAVMPEWAVVPQAVNRPVWPSAPTADLAWLFGLYIADGNANPGHRVTITLGRGETESVTRACRAWASLGLRPRLVEEATYTRVVVDSAVAANSFRVWFGACSAEKHIPEFLYHGWDTRALVEGITDGDGCAHRQGYVISTTSKRLALQIHQLLLTHGERPSMQVQPRNGGEYPNASPGWTVTWNTGGGANIRMRHWGDYYLMPVREVRRERYTGTVWNYEIEDTHTYLTNNIVSHNCMALDGYHTEGGKEYGHIVNSWGPEAHTGPVGWGDPGPDGFWAEAAVVDRMLRAGDSWAFSGVTGFPARKPLDWFVAAPARPHDRRQFAPPLFALAP